MCFKWSTNWGFISQKKTFFIVTAVKTSMLTRQRFLPPLGIEPCHQSVACRSMRACGYQPSTGNMFSCSGKPIFPVAGIKPTQFRGAAVRDSCHAGVQRRGWAPENKLNRDVNRINGRPLPQRTNRCTMCDEPYLYCDLLWSQHLLLGRVTQGLKETRHQPVRRHLALSLLPQLNTSLILMTGWTQLLNDYERLHVSADSFV
jgi:hypothetical protein